MSDDAGRIVAFLRARLDDDERIAQAATQGRWFWADPSEESFPQQDGSLMADQGDWERCGYFCRWSGESNLHRGEQGQPGHEHRKTELVVSGWGYDACGLDVGDEDAAHIVRYEPARALREVRAKRAILDEYDAARMLDPRGAAASALADVVVFLSTAWDEHPDFDASWTVETAQEETR